MKDENRVWYQKGYAQAEADIKSGLVGVDITWVERLVPEHLEDAAHDLITALLKSHGYNWEGEKQ